MKTITIEELNNFINKFSTRFASAFVGKDEIIGKKIEPKHLTWDISLNGEHSITLIEGSVKKSVYRGLLSKKALEHYNEQVSKLKPKE